MLHCRWMIRRDLPEVLTIEARCHERNPWQEEDFLQCLRQSNCIGMVVERGQEVDGYRFVWRLKGPEPLVFASNGVLNV